MLSVILHVLCSSALLLLPFPNRPNRAGRCAPPPPLFIGSRFDRLNHAGYNYLLVSATEHTKRKGYSNVS
jgi:hypothetical protein